MLLGEYIHALVSKSGGDPNSEDVKNFLLNGELMKIEMPESISKQIDSNLISLKDAKNNHPDIKAFYVNQALTPLDQQLEELFEEFGFADEDKKGILSERSTYKRVPNMLRKVRELQEKKAAVGNNTDKAGFQKQIDDLHAEIRQHKAEKTKLESDYNGKLHEFKVLYSTDSIYSGLKTTFDSLPDDVKRTAIRTLIDKGLQDKQAKLTYDEHGNFVLVKQDGSNYYDGEKNQQVSPQQFVESILSHNKVLVSNPQGAAGSGTQTQSSDTQGNQQQNNGYQQQQGNPTGGNGGVTQTSPTFKSLIAESLQDINNDAGRQNAGR